MTQGSGWQGRLRGCQHISPCQGWCDTGYWIALLVSSGGSGSQGRLRGCLLVCALRAGSFGGLCLRLCLRLCDTGVWIARPLQRLPARAPRALRALAACACFIVSGIMHEVMFWYASPRGAARGTWFVFFAIQANSSLPPPPAPPNNSLLTGFLNVPTYRIVRMAEIGGEQLSVLAVVFYGTLAAICPMCGVNDTISCGCQ